MAPPARIQKKTPEERLRELEAALAKEQKERVRDRDRALLTELRLTNQVKAIKTFNLMKTQVEAKLSDLNDAVTRIGNAYAIAATRHKKAVADQGQLDALHTQMMFSILTVFTSSALSWATEFVKLGAAAGAASRLEAMERIVQETERYGGSGTVVALAARSRAQTLKDVLAKQVSIRDTMFSGVKDTAAAGLGETFSAMGPFDYPPPALNPASIEPDLYRGTLQDQVNRVDHKARSFLLDLATRIDNSSEEDWDYYNDSQFRAAYQAWKKDADTLWGASQLPAENEMADDLEKYIWALWVPRLRHDYKVHLDKADIEVERTDYVRLRDPIDDRLVALGIETEDQTNDFRGTEDERLIKWSADYQRNMKPWIMRQNG